MNSVHSTSLLELDISGSCFNDEVDLGTFLSVFHLQLVVLEANNLDLYDQPPDLSAILQRFAALRYISLRQYPFKIEELISVMKVLCGSKNMKTLLLYPHSILCFGNEAVYNVERIIKQHNGLFIITDDDKIFCIFYS
jgi:hypothetical protein